jgi:hypothetical protein
MSMSVSRWATAIYRRMPTCQDCGITLDSKNNQGVSVITARDTKSRPLLVSHQSGRYPRFVDRALSWQRKLMSS